MAHVKLILIEDVENLGLAGEEISVAPGYARNFLLPRKLAAKATPATLRMLAARKEAIEAKRKAEIAAAEALAAKLTAQPLVIPMQTSTEDQLFGSVTARTIAEKLHEVGFAIEHTKIKIEAPIKTIGDFEVEVKLHQNVKATVKIQIVKA